LRITMEITIRNITLPTSNSPYTNLDARNVLHSKAHEAPVHVCKVDPTSTYLASGSADGVVKVWATGDIKKQLATGSADTEIRIFDLGAAVARTHDRSKPQAVLDGHVSVPRGLDVSQDGKWLLSAGRDSVALLWDLSPLQEEMAAACLTMHGTYKWDNFLPWVEDPQDILAFLGHHFGLAIQGENQDEPIQNALRALAYASNATTIEALKHFDPTESSFFRGICYIFQDDKPFQLHKAALFFLPLVGNRWFNTPTPIMEPIQMVALWADWASAVDGIEHTYDFQKATLPVLFGTINSSHWHPHIVTNKRKLLEYFTSVPDDSQPLRRCLNSPELTSAISEVGNPAAMVLWLVILWLKYKELIPEVQAQLETVTKEAAQGSRRTD
jgi:hypothetical protein